MIGGPLAAALWAAVAFFNGIGRTRIPLAIGLLVLGSNAVLNEVFIFRFGWGMAGAAWATTTAELIGVALAIRMILTLDRRQFSPASDLAPELRPGRSR